MFDLALEYIDAWLLVLRFLDLALTAACQSACSYLNMLSNLLTVLYIIFVLKN